MQNPKSSRSKNPESFVERYADVLCSFQGSQLIYDVSCRVRSSEIPPNTFVEKMLHFQNTRNVTNFVRTSQKFSNQFN